MDNRSAHNGSSSHGDTSKSPGGVSPAVIVVPLLILALIAGLCFLLVRCSRRFLYQLFMKRAPPSSRVYRDTRMFPDLHEESERVRRIRSRRTSAGSSPPPRDHAPWPLSGAATGPDVYALHERLESVSPAVAASRADPLQARLLQHGDDHRERGEAARRLARSVGVDPSEPPPLHPHAGLVSAQPSPLAPQLDR